MKKVVGILFLIFTLMATVSLAAYPADLEAAELQALQEESNIEPISELDEVESLIQPRTSEGETELILDDIYKMEKEAVVTGIVDGNVYLMANKAKIENAMIYGSVYIMAQEVDITNSDIGGSVYVFGNKVKFSGNTNDFYGAGNEIELAKESYIWRSARVAAENLSVNGAIEKDLHAGINKLQVGDTAVIQGKLNYYADKEGAISEQAKIQEIQFDEVEQNEEKVNPVMDYVYEAGSVILMTLVIALVVVFCITKFTALRRSEKLGIDLLKNAGKGALVFLFMPIIAIVLMLTVIGAGIGVIGLVVYIVLLFVAISITSVEIAYRICTKKQTNEVKKGAIIGISILVSLVIWAIRFIPVIGGIVRFIAILIGLGIWYTVMFQKIKKEEVNEN